MSNIILTGMPAAGKSTAGVLLAKAVGMSFVDTDLVIQKKESRVLMDILGKDGLNEFLKMEEQAILSVNVDNTVIATGGSAVYSSRAMNFLKSTGSVFYLRVAYKEIESRISNIKTRGVVIREGQSLADLYAEREPLYEKYADHIIDCTLCDVEDTVYSIINYI